MRSQQESSTVLFQQWMDAQGADGNRRRRWLVIAGAGSGKINTLAHRVAHLIVRCAEPELLAGIEYRAESAESKSVFQGIKEGL